MTLSAATRYYQEHSTQYRRHRKLEVYTTRMGLQLNTVTVTEMDSEQHLSSMNFKSNSNCKKLHLSKLWTGFLES